jgi:hypothetical protein
MTEVEDIFQTAILTKKLNYFFLQKNKIYKMS